MTFTLEVSPEEEAQILAAAGRGQEVSDYLLTLARQEYRGQQSVPLPAKYAGMNLAEALAGRIGLFASAEPSNMAENSEEEFGKIMDEKQRQGQI